MRRLLASIGDPRRGLDQWRGYEDFHFPGTPGIPDITPESPDILHCHNLHGSYFDLRALPRLSHKLPALLTLHDTWLLSGHCACSFDCGRWKTGCGQCPDLTIYPAVRRDATAYNWQRKRAIYAKSQLYVATPSRWLMAKVEQSMLSPAVLEARVIPNGVDLTVFHPADKHTSREILGIPQDAKVLLFAANGIRRNAFKDYETLQDAVGLVAERLQGQRVLFLALGEAAPVERIGRAEVRFVAFVSDPKAVARYYQAADIYVHAARAENFPITVLEALACGTPVVATAVGGIPEQIEDGKTGFLVPPGDSAAMAARIEQICIDSQLQQRLALNAAAEAVRRFGLELQGYRYLSWYEEILENRQDHTITRADKSHIR